MRIFWGLVMLALCGCTLARVQVDVLSQRTVLENQILGTYNALDREMLLVASVRGVDAAGNIRHPPKHSPEHQDALTAMQTLAFHADDIRAFKQLGWVGEDNRGLLSAFSMDKTTVPEGLTEFAQRFTEAEFTHVIAQVNAARTVVMDRVIAVNENLTGKDRERVGRIFGKLNAENALPGERIQNPEGKWIVK